jgi:hypothetical protein
MSITLDVASAMRTPVCQHFAQSPRTSIHLTRALRQLLKVTAVFTTAHPTVFASACCVHTGAKLPDCHNGDRLLVEIVALGSAVGTDISNTRGYSKLPVFHDKYQIRSQTTDDLVTLLLTPYRVQPAHAQPTIVVATGYSAKLKAVAAAHRQATDTFEASFPTGKWKRDQSRKIQYATLLTHVGKMITPGRIHAASMMQHPAAKAYCEELLKLSIPDIADELIQRWMPERHANDAAAIAAATYCHQHGTSELCRSPPLHVPSVPVHLPKNGQSILTLQHTMPLRSWELAAELMHLTRIATVFYCNRNVKPKHDCGQVWSHT